MLASRGHQVIGCDISERVVQLVNSGQAHFREPDLDMLLSAAVQTGRLEARLTPAEAEFHIIAVPTPFQDGHKPDLSHVEAAGASIAPFLRPGDTVILESTSPVGATEMLAARIKAARADLITPVLGEPSRPGGIHVAHCPERILPGSMVRELVENDRIIGGLGEGCAARALELYASFVKGRTFLTDCRTSEFVKLVENSFRDVNIAFANELSLICERLGLDVWRAISLANRHPRVNILRPGAGVGGLCIAVDPWFIVDSAPEEARLIRMARQVNNAKPHNVVARIRAHRGRFRAPVVACFGLTYKPDVDDLRESPALEIVRALASEAGIELLVCDPWVERLPAGLEELGVTLVDPDTALRRADIVALLVGHSKFQRFDNSHFLSKVVVDAVGLLARG
jgi:UDP-N-acetyl-D-mannosaminuronic acid dehydrogenase